MWRFIIVCFVLAFVGRAAGLADSTPAVTIGPGARIIGPVTVRNTSGEIVLDVPDDGYIIIDKLGSEINVDSFAPAKH